MLFMNPVLEWNQIKSGNIPESSGIYAWYYRNGFGLADIRHIKDELMLTSNDSKKRELISDFLKDTIFNKFDEEPYRARIDGSLKPSYEGELFQKFKVSQDVIDRILCEPDVLYKINNELKGMDISFSSPLYIGMAKNLYSRITQHKSSIEKMSAIRDRQGAWSEDFEDNQFALRFVKRKLRSDKLCVTFKEVDSESSLHNMMEYIMNRINYPLLGRN